jgi:hypothetical protein
MTSGFQWTRNRERAAFSLANGDTQKLAAEKANVTDRTIRNWLEIPEFTAEVDRMTLLVGISKRAERLRIAMRVVDARTQNQFPQTKADLLDWLKFAQSETDGIKHVIEDWRNEVIDKLKTGELTADEVKAVWPDLAAEFFAKAGVDASSD